ncbi:MAG: GNAT family N-acetyltransferase, partial [Microvirga sp.]
IHRESGDDPGLVTEQGLNETLGLVSGGLMALAAARRDGRFVGYGLLDRRPLATFKVGVLRLSVLQRYWRHGIGTALVQHLIEKAEQAGDNALFLEVADNNAGARALYERLGFDSIPGDARSIDGKRLSMTLAIRR